MPKKITGRRRMAKALNHLAVAAESAADYRVRDTLWGAHVAVQSAQAIQEQIDKGRLRVQREAPTMGHVRD